MEQPPHYNFIDVLWAPAKALSLKKILLMTFFLCLGLLLYNAFTYIAVAIDGEDLNYVWSAYNFFPFIPLIFDAPIATAVYVIGLILSVLAVMLGLFGVASIDIEAARGNPFLSFFGAVKFAFKRFWQLCLSELSIAVFIALVILLGVVLGFITRIPYVGEWIFAITLFLPNFLIAIFTVFVVFVFVVSLLLLPAVAAAERKGETFTAILETFSTIIRQPVRWLGFTAYSLVMAKICGFIYAYFCFRAVQFITWTATISGGDKPAELIKSGLMKLPTNSDLVRDTFNVFPGIDWSFSIMPWAHSGSTDAVGNVMAVMLFLIFTTIYGYMFSVVAAAQTRGYVVIRYAKDDYKISDEDPLFYTEEWVNPKIKESD